MPYKLQQCHLSHSGNIIHLFLDVSVSSNHRFTIRGLYKKERKRETNLNQLYGFLASR